MRIQLFGVILLFGSGALFAKADDCPKDYQLPGLHDAHHIPEGMALGLLIENPAPKYPAVARAAHIQGIVVVNAVITVEGKLTAIKPVCGEPVLIESTIKALKKWRYRPYEIDGKPVEVDTTIRTEFALNKKS
jgi:TonB family protein